MKSLELNEMEVIEGGWKVSVGCAIVGGTMGLINPFLGFAYGLGCSLYYEYNPDKAPS